MKVLLICNTSGSIVTFRKSLIEKLQSEGCHVCAIAFDDENRDVIESRNIEFYTVPDANRSTNPFKVLSLKKKYLKIIKKVDPDVVFTFMMKPNIFGVRAAKKAGIKKIFAMVEGAGDVFINNGFKWRLIRTAVCKMYRKSFKSACKVFFLNSDDKSEFVSRGLVKQEKCEIIPGIGVDMDHFEYKPLKNYNTFLMIARMLKTKGVMEYCQAARIVKKKYPDAVFDFLGAEGTVKVADIQEYIDDGSVNYLGTTKDVRPYIENCAVYVLPSYREGMPISVVEAEAVGRAVIVSDVPGCRESMIVDENGLMCEVANSESLADKIIWCIEHPKDVELFGINSRKLAEDRFDCIKINDKLSEIILSPAEI